GQPVRRDLRAPSRGRHAVRPAPGGARRGRGSRRGNVPRLLAQARRCAARTVAVALCSRTKAAREPLPGNAPRDVTPGLPPSEDAFLPIARDDVLARAFARLSEADREVLRLVAWEQLSLRAAARTLGCSQVT